MWKKLSSLLKGKKGECPKNNVLESVENIAEDGYKPDLNTMFSKMFEDECAFLTFAQSELSKARYLHSQGKLKEVRDTLKPLGLAVRTSLVANYNSEQYEKLLDIIEIATIVADTYIKEDNYKDAFDELNDAKTYTDELTLFASNRQGVLKLIVSMYCKYLKCCCKLDKVDEIEMIKKMIESALALLSSCITRSSVSDKIQSIERICDYVDELIPLEAYKDVYGIFKQVLSFIEWEELEDYSLKHSYAILYGRYVRCLLNSRTDDIDACMSSCVSEVEMYEDLLKENKSNQARMDLAVAFSHMAECYSLKEDNPNFVTSHIRKIALLVDAIKVNAVDEDKIYDNKKLSESIVISIKNCIKKFGEVNSSNVNHYTDIFNAIKDVNHYYLDNSELLAYINMIAGELFKNIKEKDFVVAQDCLVTRFTSLLYLLNNYGPEKDVVKDFADTIVFAQPFIINNEKRINDELRELWINSYSKAKELFKLT